MQFDRLKRREFISLLGGAASWPLTARAQKSEGMRSIWPIFAPGQDEAAKALGITYTYFDMPQAEAVGTAMSQAVAAGAQGAVMRGSPYFSSIQRRVIIDTAAENRLPTIYERRDDAERGGLVSYAPDVQGQY